MTCFFDLECPLKEDKNICEKNEKGVDNSSLKC